jgi:hypothetical protein
VGPACLICQHAYLNNAGGNNVIKFLIFRKQQGLHFESLKGKVVRLYRNFIIYNNFLIPRNMHSNFGIVIILNCAIIIQHTLSHLLLFFEGVR